MTNGGTPMILNRPDGERVAYHARKGSRPGTVVWLGGFKSDMTGTKATALDRWAETASRSYLRFDYFGHGASSGAFIDGTVGRWRDDALAAIDELTEGPLVLVGSSMGGWIATLAALARPARVAGIVFIAPAPDFTEELMWRQMPEAIKREIETKGFWQRPSAYDPEPYTITRRLIEEGRDHLVLNGPIAIRCPVHILHGMQDPDVPWRHALRLVEALDSKDVTLTLLKDGDHRLSTPDDIALLCKSVDEMCGKVLA